MQKTFTRHLLSVLFHCAFLVAGNAAFAQTIAIRNVDAGPYGQGSSISAAIVVDDATGCIGIANAYNLYLSDASGNFASETLIGTFTGNYTGFVNGVIPNGTPAGTGYKVRVKATIPSGVVSNPSGSFSITAAPGVTATASSSSTSSASAEVFGSCAGREGAQYGLTSALSSSHNVTLNFYNDMTQQDEGTRPIPASDPNILFTARASSYTVTTKAINSNGTVGTKSYLLINNVVNIIFGAQNSGAKCLVNGTANVGFSVDYQSPDGIQRNYPGNRYLVTWGDGRTDTYTYCQIRNQLGKLSHDFNTSSCGSANSQGQVTNQFQVKFSLINPYCPPPSGDNPNTITISQSILLPPRNLISGPDKICINTPAVFSNISDPGQVATPNGSNTCRFTDATYRWYVDGSIKATGKRLSDKFTWTFTTNGQHEVKLELENSPSSCVPDAAIANVCVENPPKAEFTIPALQCAGTTPVTPTDKSFLDDICNTTFVYTWKVTPSTGVTYTNGSNANSRIPQFQFANPGTYRVDLTITGSPCGPAVAAPQTIVINTVPVAQLSANFSLCGKERTLVFDNTNGSQTQTTLTGTTQSAADTYQWTVSPSAGVQFVNGTSANSQYPQIFFPDFGTYTVTVTQTNTCGATATDSQNITFLQAPTVNAGPDQTLCPSDIASLSGSINGTYSSVRWTGAGSFSNAAGLTTTYTPTQAERNAGRATVTLTATTNLPGECASIADQLVLNINPANINTGANTKVLCTGNPVDYNPSSSVTGSTFTWVTLAGATNVSGHSASGTGNITDVLTATSATANGTVTYRITPRANNCDGTPYDLVVTVRPKPELVQPVDHAVCSGQPAGITLASNVSGTVYTWSFVAGPNISGANARTTPAAATAITDVLTNSSNAAQTVVYTITPYTSGTVNDCPGTVRTVTITVQPTTPRATAGADITLCNLGSYQLQGNDPAPFTGTWTGPAGVTFADATQYNTTVSGLQPGQSYTLRWTINGQSPCGPESDDVVITVNPAATNNSISTNVTTTCFGNSITITGSTPTGGNGTYTYSWESSADNGITWSVLANQTGQSLNNFQVFQTTSFRRLISSGACSGILSNVITITVQPPIANNTISAPAPSVCINNSAGTLNGSNPTGGDGTNYTYQWQSSTDNGVTFTNISGATGKSYTTPLLTATTQYRRIVSTSLCTSSTSNALTITVNPNARALFTAATQTGCADFVLTSSNIVATQSPDRNQTYTWFAGSQQIGTGPTFPGYTIVGAGQSMVIKLVVTSRFGCLSDEFSMTFNTVAQFTAAYTLDKTSGCGPTAVTITNTSSPIGAATYFWDFGNGQTSTSAQPGQITYQPNTDGTDKVYTITLTVTTGCGAPAPIKQTVLIKPAVPVARLSPDNTTGCAPFTVNLTNLSPGTNDRYIFHVVNASGTDVQPPITVTDKSPRSFTLTASGQYAVYLEAVSACGTGRSGSIPVTVSPPTLFSGITTATAAERTGCAPLAVTFINTSQGATSFRYDWNDGTQSTAINTNNISHTFTTAGTYRVTLYSSNDCSKDLASATLIITVNPKPVPAFSADNLNGCNKLTVNFTNQTVDPNGGYNYEWDFGDPKATASNPNTSDLRTPPPHTYDYTQSPYTVRLTVTNPGTGCSDVITRTITVNAPAIADFRVRPDSVTSIPNYSFSFEDQSTNNPVSWRWNFGDGSTSTSRNPTHTYADTGVYKVTLTSTNSSCGTSKTHTVRITGTPGQLFVPNAFMPTGNVQDLRIFMAKGSGIKQWRMRIFNNYGQVVFETSKLDGKGAPVDGWDGTFMGSLVPQGVYLWQIEATFINGVEWPGMSYNGSAPKRNGFVNLIR